MGDRNGAAGSTASDLRSSFYVWGIRNVDVRCLTVQYRLMWIQLEMERLRGFEEDHPRAEDGKFTFKSGKEVASGEKSGIIKVEPALVISKIQSGEITLKLNEEKQLPHLKGEKYVSGKSYFTISLDEIQSLVYRNYAKGNVYAKRDGRIQEVVKTEKTIGNVVNPKTGAEEATSSMKIHYSRKRTHAVPRRDEDGEN